MTHARAVLALFLLAALSLPACSSPDASSQDTASDAWTPLFNGDNLEGWTNPYEWGEAWVEDGVIHLRADEKFFLVTEDTYSDFVFEGEVRLPDRESNSGFMFRANVDTNRVYGYQAEVDPTDRAWAGGIYDEGRRGWLYPPDGDSAAGQAFREGPGQAFNPDQWNTYRIRAEGDSLKVWVNGTMTTAYRDTMDSEGVIGIQHHGEDGKIYRFRNLRIRSLDGAASAD